MPGSEISRDSIASITFADTLDGAPNDAWDVSEAGDGSVLAWAVPNGKMCDLTIAGRGGVGAPEDSSYLFSEYSNMISLNFNDCFDTSAVTDMSDMFSSCSSLTNIQYGISFVTEQAYISGMFDNCPYQS